MLSLIISIILLGLIIWGIPLMFLQKNKPVAYTKNSFCTTHLTITAKNAEDSIEGIVRSLAWQISNNPNPPTDVYIIDMQSSDQTLFISQKLAEEYNFIHPISKADYIAAINSFE